ncbi:hypothetical protein [Herbaspirillum huttiense]|uniref:hypothetical protein n=1 Tax=Herbaspirillum huttiense TaxID=863372 RepID=UPI0021769BBA|nr:hypothetical protein [Herbaspirillum huttiense]UWE17690.1 hypothetical protein NY669_05795 [Herbaspirillum huttiense]
MKIKKNPFWSAACLCLAIDVTVAHAQIPLKKNVSQAQMECERAAREAPSCLPNNVCAEQKLKETERWCIQWMRENTPWTPPVPLNGTAMGMNTK